LSTSFATKLGTQLAKNLYKYYLNQDILFYSQNNTSKLLKKINNDTEIVIDNFFIPLIQINAKIILLIVIIFFLFFINPLILISGFLFFFLIYYVVYKVIRLKIQKISLSNSIANEDRFKIVKESFYLN
jgi:ABC-type multidrug transport system fused ATPase/permease subunit